jgi:hypothetical protein
MGWGTTQWGWIINFAIIFVILKVEGKLVIKFIFYLFISILSLFHYQFSNNCNMWEKNKC